MGRFGRGGGTPRVVGFDFTPPPAATPWTEGAAAPAAEHTYDQPVAYEPPVAYEQPVAYDPPVYAAPDYPPPAYPPPAYPAPAAEPMAYEAPVATLPPPVVPAPVAVPAPMQLAPPARAAKAKHLLRTGGAVVLSVGLIAGRVYLRTADDESSAPAKPVAAGPRRLVTPTELGNLPRLRSADAQEVEQRLTRLLPAAQQPQGAVYGVGGKGSYLLMAHLPATSNSMTALKGYTGAAKELGDRVGTPKRLAGGVACATVTTPGRGTRVYCAWGGNLSNGAVIEFGTRDLAAVAKVAIEARTKVNGG